MPVRVGLPVQELHLARPCLLKVVPLDMFTEAFPPADVITMSQVVIAPCTCSKPLGLSIELRSLF